MEIDPLVHIYHSVQILKDGVHSHEIPIELKRSLGNFAASRYGGAYRLANEDFRTRRTIQNYAYKVKNRMVMKEKGGRPKSLDSTAVELLSEFLNERGRLSWKDLVKYMTDQQRHSWCRYRNIIYEEVSDADWPKRLSRRTILQYLKTLGYSREDFD